MCSSPMPGEKWRYRSRAMNTEESVISIGSWLLRIEERWNAGVLIGICLGAAAPGSEQRLSPTGRELLEIIMGERTALSVSVRAEGTPFQKKVWSAASAVPRGRVVTYGELARALKCGSPRAVGQALKANPLPIVVPCHRVVASKGLGGYSCGTWIKEILLKIEGSLNEDSGH